MWGAPPLHTATKTRGRRLFANGTTDRKGLWRRPPPSDSNSPADSDMLVDEADAVTSSEDNTKISLKRKVAAMIRSSSDSESSESETSRSKRMGDKFRTVPVQIRTTPKRSRPLAGPWDSDTILLPDSGSESEVQHPPPQKRPQVQPQTSTSSQNAKRKQRARPIKVST